MSKREPISSIHHLASELKHLIQESRQQVAVAVNSAISMLYWQIGKRINEEILQNKRAAYGKEIVHTLSTQLTVEFGKGWSEKQLRHCLRFAEIFPDQEIVSSLWRQLSEEYGSAFFEKNLHRMMQFAKVFSEKEIEIARNKALDNE